MDIKGVNHITFSVSDIKKSIKFYQDVFNAKLLVEGETLAYFDLKGLWLALNLEADIPRKEIHQSYTHMSFSIDEEEYEDFLSRLMSMKIEVSTGRPRYPQEGKSIYFKDPDGHKFEFHTKTLSDRIAFYKANKRNLKFYI